MAGVGRRFRQDERGISMIETIVVVLIVTILASLALAVFLQARSGAQDREAMMAVRTARVAIEVHKHDTGTYAATTAQLEALDPALKNARALRVTGDAGTYRLTVDSPSGSRGGGTFTIERHAGARIVRSCANPGRGGCRATPDADGNAW